MIAKYRLLGAEIGLMHMTGMPLICIAFQICFLRAQAPDWEN